VADQKCQRRWPSIWATGQTAPARQRGTAYVAGDRIEHEVPGAHEDVLVFRRAA
jgi:hypothetical protein